jgi:hypothetical protein
MESTEEEAANDNTKPGIPAYMNHNPLQRCPEEHFFTDCWKEGNDE